MVLGSSIILGPPPDESLLEGFTIEEDLDCNLDSLLDGVLCSLLEFTLTFLLGLEPLELLDLPDFLAQSSLADG